ncbi:hypothetical protein ACHAWU_001324 [Discostella pseudostelligera]|uniref:Uncharacterized protein n=1 Tax=Discostella pseudostelligera TaxID=259834 RepID=A0ABD3MD00_9STRA
MSITNGETTVPTPYPTYIYAFPTYAPIAPTATCTGSTPGWVDVFGNGCAWWEEYDEPGCPYGGDENTGGPKDNCCYCFGDPPLTKNPEIIEDITQLIACGISAISVWALLFAILRNSTVRSNTFNLYLVFSLVPDAVYFPWMLVNNSLSLVDDINFYTTGYYLNLLGDVFWYIELWCANFWVCARIVAASITVLWWVYENELTDLDTVHSNTVHTNTANYRLLASTYLMVGGAVTKQVINRYEPDGNSATKYFLRYTYCIYYLFGFFQVCLALTKKDIRGAFVEMWCCCRKHDYGVTRSGTFFGRLTRTTRESYGPEDDGYDVDPPNVNDATSSAVNPTVLNLDNHHPNENDGNEANTSFVESTEQNDGTIVGDIDEGKIEENCSVIDEISNEIAMSKGDKDSEQNDGTIVGDIDEEKFGENCSVVDEISNEIVMSKGDKDSEYNDGTIVGDIDEGKIEENCSVIDEISNEIVMSKGDKDSVQV